MTLAEFIRRAMSITFIDRGNGYEGCDCFGLAALAYREVLGIRLPDYPEIDPGANLAKLRAIVGAAAGPNWTEIAAGHEQSMDVILLRGQIEHEGTKYSRPIHVGMVTEPGTLIHIEVGSGVSVINYRQHPRIRHRIAGFYRYT